MTESFEAPMLTCAGCGAEVPVASVGADRCPRATADDDVEHVLRAPPPPADTPFGEGTSENPFVRFRALSVVTRAARACGVDDPSWIALVEELDTAVAAVDGHGFVTTPLLAGDALARAAGHAGALWIKDETGNVSGSHKARHLFGLALHLRLLERLGLRVPHARRLAIASCGNAALAAAVLARALDEPLDVFVPVDAEPAILAALERHGATIHPCERREGERGDPCHLRFREAIAAGADAFSCQGPDHGLTIDGGRTLGHELASQLAAHGAALDHVFVQVGGGALATACWRALQDALAAGVLPRLPRVHTVQTAAAAPLARALERLREDLGDAAPPDSPADPDAVAAALAHAARHRSRYMQPWETTPCSVAHCILDDETYDWLACAEAMLLTGGRALVLDEDSLREAHALAREHTDVPVDASGAAGLAGLLALRRDGALVDDDAVAVLFTGQQR